MATDADITATAHLPVAEAAARLGVSPSTVRRERARVAVGRARERTGRKARAGKPTASRLSGPTVTDEERKEAERIVASTGLSLPDYIRTAVTSEKVAAAVKREARTRT